MPQSSKPLCRAIEDGDDGNVKKRRRLLSDSASDPDSNENRALSQDLSVMASKFDTFSETSELSEDIKENALTMQDSLSKSAVAPFLTKHIPSQYAPLGDVNSTTRSLILANANTKQCYRHRPDLKCRRQADEPSMDQLQRELAALSQNDQRAIAHVWSLFSAAPARHRELMLRGILSQCCFSQLSYISANVRDLIRIDFVSTLPVEIAFKILCYLDTTSLCKAAQVCRTWRTLADDDVVWHKMCEQHIDRKCTKCGWGLPLFERKRLRATKRQIQLRASGLATGRSSQNAALLPPPALPCASRNKRKLVYTDLVSIPDVPVQHVEGEEKHVEAEQSSSSHHVRSWKEVYRDRFKVGANWKYGRCSIRIFKGHTNGVMCLQFMDNVLATGSYDTTIKIWDTDTGEEWRTLTGHTAGVRCLQFDDSKLISGSLDNTLKVWNWRTGVCLNTLMGHTGGVIGLHFEGNLLASGSTDRTIKIWNFDNKSRFLLRGHTDWVNSVKIDVPSRTLFSASDDCTARLWDLDNKTCLRVFEGHVGQVQQVVPLPHEFEYDESEPVKAADDKSSDSGSEGDSGTPKDTPKLRNFGPAFENGRPAPPRYMLTAALDSTIRLWDVLTGKCLHTFFGHIEGVWALAANTLRVISGAEDRMVKVWDPRTGVCERTFTGHSSPVTCVCLTDGRMATGSEDCEVRMYNFRCGVSSKGCN